uniref:Origin recognition complex subunit 1 n=1 Tax=Strigamia maritima TaxID=126957 RepID=T1JIW5_STRMM
MLTESEPEVFKWIGMGSDIKQKRTNKKFHESFSNGCLVIRKLDYVTISNEDAGDLSDTTEECFIARVLDLYDDGSGSDSRHRAVVEWYLRPKDLKQNKRLSYDFASFNEKNEVFRYCGKKMWDVDIDAESIFSTCRLITLPEREKVPDRFYDNGEPLFYTRFSYNGVKLTAEMSIQVENASNLSLNEARRCLFDTNSPVKEEIEKKSPFRSFYSSGKKRKSITVINNDRDLKKRKLFSDDEEPKKTKGKMKKKMKKKMEVKCDENDDRFEEARRSLHVSMLPTHLPCRESEYKEIYSFVKGKLESGSNGCVYISGFPGSGKTATVLEVMKNLTEERNNEDLCDFKFIALNGMKLTDPQQIYVQMVKELTDQKMSSRYAIDYLTKNLGKWRKEQIVLLVDELDLLYTKRQEVLYNLFDWPSRPKARLIVVAVANTMNLPERIMTNRVVSRVGMSRITFQPYTFKQLEEIINSRVSELGTFVPDAIKLVARKVGAVSGDARRALDICRRATEIADKCQSRKGSVGVKDVDKALQEMFSSPKFMAIENASLNEQMLLRAIAAQFSHSGVEECTWEDVYSSLVTLCRLEGISPPNESQACAACFQLASCRLIIAQDGRKDMEQKIRLNVSTDDIAFALN